MGFQVSGVTFSLNEALLLVSHDALDWHKTKSHKFSEIICLLNHLFASLYELFNLLLVNAYG